MLWLIFAFSVFGFAGPPIWFYEVPSNSMADTLIVGDVFIASLDAYAVKDPERGDVAVFVKNGTVYVKRVIGLPGERVQMSDGTPYLDGRPVERTVLARPPAADEGSLVVPDRVTKETLPNGIHYETLDMKEGGVLANTPEVTVPAGQYFVLGDNRDNSVDSRSPEIGLVPRDRFIGRAAILIFSLSRESGEWRGDRFLQPIK